MSLKKVHNEQPSKFEFSNENLKKVKVEKVEIDKKNIYLNNKKYDLVFFPSCFNIKKITIDNKNFWVKPKRSISNHLTVMFKNFKFIPNPCIFYSFCSTDRRIFVRPKLLCRIWFSPLFNHMPPVVTISQDIQPRMFHFF